MAGAKEVRDAREEVRLSPGGGAIVLCCVRWVRDVDVVVVMGCVG